MTNYQNIKDMTIKELASFLCNLMCAECCENRCPAEAFCGHGQSGMEDWLESEVDDK